MGAFDSSGALRGGAGVAGCEVGGGVDSGFRVIEAISLAMAVLLVFVALGVPA